MCFFSYHPIEIEYYRAQLFLYYVNYNQHERFALQLHHIPTHPLHPSTTTTTHTEPFMCSGVQYSGDELVRL